MPYGFRRMLCIAFLVTLAFHVVATCKAGELGRIEIAADNQGFIKATSGETFHPWGFNYDHDGDGKLIEDYWEEDWSTVASDFQEMRHLGANVVRIHLQFGKFMENPSRARASSLQQLRRLLALAEEHTLYLDITGLGCYHRQDVPSWYDALSEPDRWHAQATFWETIAQTCAESPAVFCYDLMNEPVVPGGDKPRDDWLGPAFGGKHFTQFVALDRAQRDRPDIAHAWIHILVTAIRKHDKRHLITIGMVPWSLERPGLTSGFIPEKVADELDFVSVHIYPEQGKLDKALATLKGFAAVDKPVVIEEFFPLKCDAKELGRFIDASRSHAAGWIGFYWGTTPAEYREQPPSIANSLTLGWLELFQEKGKAIHHGSPGNLAFLVNGVTAHRGDSANHPENTMPAFKSGIETGADWIELDIFRTKDGKLVVIHDDTTKRTGDINLNVVDATYEELRKVDVATDFRKRTGQSINECPPLEIPLLEDVLRLVMKQHRTRVSIQPKMNCVAEAVALVHAMRAQQWVGFNDGNLQLMAEVKRLAPETPVFWDRGANTSLDEDIRIAQKNGFQSLVLHQSGVTSEQIKQIQAAGIEAGAWTVNDPQRMRELIDMGLDRIYTDHPRILLAMNQGKPFRNITCEGTYQHHLQGVCTDSKFIYWCFTTQLVKTDLDGKVLTKTPVANHHGDLCHHDGKLYVAVNLGAFNDPKGNADSWVYIYDARSLKELSRHKTNEVFHGAGGIGYRNGHFFVVGGLPNGIEENYVYEYDDSLRFVKKHIIKSGHTLLGIQTATFAHDRWWFGCYGNPQILLVTDADFAMKGRFQFNCSLGIEGLSDGKLLSATGQCTSGKGCTGKVVVMEPDTKKGLTPVQSIDRQAE